MALLEPRDRLIVAADFAPDATGSEGVYLKVINLVRALRKTGVIIKVSSVLRYTGYELIGHIHQHELRVFADLKLCDTADVLAGDAHVLAPMRPHMLSAMCAAGTGGLRALRERLPRTEVLGVALLRSLLEGDMHYMYRTNLPGQVFAYAKVAEDAGLDGMIAPPDQIEPLRSSLLEKMRLTAQGIVPDWWLAKNENENRGNATTVVQAIKRGADRVIVGKQITEAANPYEATIRTLAEIADATQ